jgi:hypothetical protein
MKITLQDSSFVNWEKVAEAIKESAVKQIVKALEDAQVLLGKLKPGERKTIPIKLASITISKSKD